MADDTIAAAAQAALDATSQADTDTDSSQADTGTAQAADTVAREEHRKVQREAQNLRKRLAEVEAKVKAADDAKLSETERIQQRQKELEDQNAKLLSQIRERDTREAVVAAALKIGALDADVVYRVVKDDLTVSDAGEVENLDKALKKAQAKHPALFGKVAGSADGGSGSRGKSAGGDLNAWLRGERA